MNIHAQKHSNQHYEGNYFGPRGAVAGARGAFLSAQSNFQLADISRTSEHYTIRASHVYVYLIALISTLYSALMPAIKSFRFLTAFKLLKELRKMLTLLRVEYGYGNHYPMELEVTLVALTKAWILPPSWVRRDALLIGRLIIAHNDVTPATKLLTMARLSSRKEISKILRDEYRTEVVTAVTIACTSATHQNLHWETIARLASMVNLPAFMSYAAYMDGRPDVVQKYGFSISNAVIHKIKSLRN